MNRQAKLEELDKLHAKIRELEAELAVEPADWPPRQYYTAYYVTTGALLGFLGAATSLVFNVVGSLVWPALGGTPQHPLRLIAVYLTFPLGESAMKLDNDLLLAIGCCLYLATGMFYGILFQLAFSRWIPTAGLGKRLLLAVVVSLAIWIVNFYGILSWLQPLLFGGRWILDLIPWWVAAFTHLVFGWTMAIVYPLGLFVPYRAVSEER